MLVAVYDIKNSGPRHRFVANGKLVHNSDSINMQNLPSRGANANKLKRAIIAPPGHVLIDADSSQIEARTLAWWSGHGERVVDFAEKRDVYRKMASAIYNKPAESITTSERFVGKSAVLGCGYGLGAVKFQSGMQTFNVSLELEECRRIVNVYRSTHSPVVELWRQAQRAIEALARKDHAPLGKPGVVEVVPSESAIRLPSGLLIRYDDLRAEPGEKGMEYSYVTRKGRVRLYGGKCVENLCQGIARCIISEQMLRVSKRYRVVLTVHDAIMIVAHKSEADEARAYVEECMRWVPEWAAGLPLDCESGMAESYGDC